MSDNAIRVGDLVVVIKPYCCGCTNAIGKIFQVLDVREVRPGAWKCDAGHAGVHSGYVAAAYGPGIRDAEALPLLRRIDPLWDLDEAERKIEEPIT